MAAIARLKPRIVILVPWRGGDELREQSWAVVRPYYERTGWPLFTGDSPGAWSRAAAVNAAARAAGNWDVAVVADADTIPPPLGPAAQRVTRTGGGIRPHDHLVRLTPSGSLRIAMSGPEHLEPRHVEKEHPGGGLLVVSREGWDLVGGFDEQFVGWGHEDTAFNIALLLKADWDRMPGTAYHLWHPEPNRKTRHYSRNRMLVAKLKRDNNAAIRAKEIEKGWSVGSHL